MAREKKDGKHINLYIEKEIYDIHREQLVDEDEVEKSKKVCTNYYFKDIG